MVNYTNGRIYKLVNKVNDKIYVGSTCNSLRQRKAEHKSSSTNPKKSETYVYKHLNEICWSGVEIILIESYPCKTKDELRKRERYWIDELKPELNMRLPDRSKHEYYIDNKNDLDAKGRAKYQENKQHVLEVTKLWFDNNKDKMLAWRKQYKQQKYHCECGTICTQGSKSSHVKTKKHHDLIARSLQESVQIRSLSEDTDTVLSD